MKNKIVRLLLAVVLLGSLPAILVVITHYRELATNTLPLDELWIFQADERIVATPILIDDQIIFRTADKIYSINAENGKTNWEIAAMASSITINVNLLGKPLVGNSKFLVSEEQNNSIGIYSTKTGEKLWTVDGQADFVNALAIVDDVMIVAQHDGNLDVYDLTSQQKLWEVALPVRSPTPVAVNADMVIVGMTDILHVYGLKDGRLLKEKTFDRASIWGIELNESNLFVNYAREGGDESISSLKIDSLDENWVFHAGKITDPNISLTGNHLSVFNPMLILLNTNDGNVIWKDEGQKFYSAPAFHENSMFYVSVQQMLGDKKICKVEIGKGMMANCSVIDNSGIKQYLNLPGPLVTDDLLIVPRASEIVAFTIP